MIHSQKTIFKWQSENEDEVSSFIPMQIYRNSQLLKTKDLQLTRMCLPVASYSIQLVSSTLNNLLSQLS